MINLDNIKVRLKELEGRKEGEMDTRGRANGLILQGGMSSDMVQT